jgi:hypothetical protein
MKKILSFSILFTLVALVISNLNADSMTSYCSLDGRELVGDFNNVYYETNPIKCSDGIKQCYTTLFTTPDKETYHIYNLNFDCDNSTILVNGVRCFYNDNDSTLTCVVADDKNFISFSENGKTFLYPKDVPLVKFMVR